MLLLQMDSRGSTRLWAEFPTLQHSIDEIIRLYETNAKETTTLTKITYQIEDLYRFVDGLHEVCVLEYSETVNAYVPHGRDWVREMVRVALSRF